MEKSKNQVAEMKTLEDLRSILAQLETAEKSEKEAAKMCAQVDAVIEGFKGYDWSQFKAGKFIFLGGRLCMDISFTF